MQILLEWEKQLIHCQELCIQCSRLSPMISCMIQRELLSKNICSHTYFQLLLECTAEHASFVKQISCILCNVHSQSFIIDFFNYQREDILYGSIIAMVEKCLQEIVSENGMEYESFSDVLTIFTVLASIQIHIKSECMSQMLSIINVHTPHQLLSSLLLLVLLQPQAVQVMYDIYSCFVIVLSDD